MRCDTAREAISARMDGEPGGVSAVRLQLHLDDCAACREWSALAELLRPGRDAGLDLAEVLPGRRVEPDSSTMLPGRGAVPEHSTVLPDEHARRDWRHGSVDDGLSISVRWRPARIPNMVRAVLAFDVGLLTAAQGFNPRALLLAAIMVSIVALVAQFIAARRRPVVAATAPLDRSLAESIPVVPDEPGRALLWVVPDDRPADAVRRG